MTAPRGLSLLTWNCFGAAMGVVSFLRWRGAADHERFAHPSLAETLSAVDVVCLQEVFLTEAEEFFEALPHAHKARERNHNTLRPFTVGGSGLGIASRFPLEGHAVRGFSRPQVGSERFARKGSLAATLSLPTGERLHVVTTHMQSGYHERAGTVRVRQLEELRAVVDALPADEPVLVSGDFNICGLEHHRALREYAALARTFSDFEDAGAAEDHPTFETRVAGPGVVENLLARRFEPRAKPQRIDYVLFRPGSSALRVAKTDVVFTGAITTASGRATHPSDHFALRVELAASLRDT